MMVPLTIDGISIQWNTVILDGIQGSYYAAHICMEPTPTTFSTGCVQILGPEINHTSNSDKV